MASVMRAIVRCAEMAGDCSILSHELRHTKTVSFDRSHPILRSPHGPGAEWTLLLPSLESAASSMHAATATRVERTPLYHFVAPRYWRVWLILGFMRLVYVLPLRLQRALGARAGRLALRLLH